MGDYPTGYAGTILRIDLTSKDVVRQKLDEEIISQFIGGRGFNAKYLYDEVHPDTDPLGPQNKIMFGIGPCAGTTVPGAQCYNVTAKSPLTGFIGDSNSGGDFGAALKYAG
ncbi:MAG: hypothetical protein JRJ85_12215 [Deltaproteobacteria bacterium]|nr:hypothetical protein [Deltaproteobacteria bacterium]